MAVTITTKFYADSTWHDMAKIVFTSPYLENPSLRGTRSHILPGRLSLGMWYEDDSYMYRIADEQIEDILSYFEKNNDYIVTSDYSLSSNVPFITISGISQTVNDSLYQKLKTKYDTNIYYTEINTKDNSTITVSGTDPDNIDSMFLSGKLYDNENIINRETESSIVPVWYRTGFCDAGTNEYFKNELLYVENVEVNRDKVIKAKVTKDNGWVGKRTGEDCYIDFEFIEPIRISKLTFDNVVYQSNENTEYDVNSISDLNWADKERTVIEGGTTVTINYEDSWTISGSKWISDTNNEEVIGCGPSSTYTYGINDVTDFNSEDYYDDFKITKIKVTARNDNGEDWTILYDGSFDGEAIFNQDDKFKYYRLYLIEALNESCPVCMAEIKYNAVYPITTTVSGVNTYDTESILSIFGENNISDNEVFYMTSSGTDAASIYYLSESIDGTNDRTDLNAFAKSFFYNENVGFDYSRTIKNTDTISAGWHFNKIDDGDVYINFEFDAPKRITGLSVGEVVHNIKREINVSYNNLNDPTWADKTKVITDDSGNQTTIVYDDEWAIIDDKWESSVTSITTDYNDTNTYLLCYGIPKNKKITLDNITKSYDITKIKFQGFDGTNYIDLYEGFVDNLVYFNHDGYYTKYRLYVLESTLSNFKKNVLESTADNTSMDDVEHIRRIWYEEDISAYDVIVGEGYCTTTIYKELDLPKDNIFIIEASLHVRARFDSSCTSGFRIYLANSTREDYREIFRHEWGTAYSDISITDWTALEWYKLDITEPLRDMIANGRWLYDENNNRITTLNVLLRGHADNKVEGQLYYRGYGGFGDSLDENSPYIEIKWRTNEVPVNYKEKPVGYYTANLTGSDSTGLTNIFANGYVTNSGIENISTISGSKDIDILFRAENKFPNKLSGFGRENLFYDKVNFTYEKSIVDNSTIEEGWVAKDVGDEPYIDFTFEEPTRIVKIDFDPVNHNYDRSIVTKYIATTFSGGTYAFEDDVIHYDNTFSKTNDIWRCGVQKIDVSDGMNGYGICYGLKSSLTGDTVKYSDKYEVTYIKIEARKDATSNWELLYDGAFNGEAIFKHRNLYKTYRMYIKNPINKDINYIENLPFRSVQPSNYFITAHNLNTESSNTINKIFDKGNYVYNETFITTLSGNENVNLNYSLEYGDDNAGQDFTHDIHHLEPVSFNFTKTIIEEETIDKGWVAKKDDSDETPYIMLSFDSPIKLRKLEFDPVVHKSSRDIKTIYNSLNDMNTNTIYNDNYTGANINISFNGSWSKVDGKWVYDSSDDVISLSNYGNNTIVNGRTYNLDYETNAFESYEDTYNVNDITIIGMIDIDGLNSATLYSGPFNGDITFENDDYYKYYKIFLNKSYKIDCVNAPATIEEIPNTNYTITPDEGMSNTIENIFDKHKLVENKKTVTTLSGIRDVDVWCKTESCFGGIGYVDSMFKYLYKHPAPFNYTKTIDDTETLDAGYKSEHPFTFKVSFDNPTNIAALSFDTIDHVIRRKITHDYKSPNYNIPTISGHLDSLGGEYNDISHEVDVKFEQDWTKDANGLWKCTLTSYNSTCGDYSMDVCYGFEDENDILYDEYNHRKYGASKIIVVASNDDIDYTEIYNGNFDGYEELDLNVPYKYYKIKIDEPVYNYDYSKYIDAPLFSLMPRPTISGSEDNIITLTNNIGKSGCTYEKTDTDGQKIYGNIVGSIGNVTDDNQYMGKYNGKSSDAWFIFDSLDIPNGSKIIEAYIEFKARPFSGNSSLADMGIFIWNKEGFNYPSDIPITLLDTNDRICTSNCGSYKNHLRESFNYGGFDEYGNPVFIGGLRWKINSWTSDTLYKTPDLSIVLQRIVDKQPYTGSATEPSRPGWESGNPIFISFVETSNSYYDSRKNYYNDSTHSPTLVVKYQNEETETGINDNNYPPEVINPASNRYKPINVKDNCTVNITGSDDAGIEGIFEDGYICEAFESESIIEGGNDTVPVVFYVNHSFNDNYGLYRFTDTYIIKPEFEFNRSIKDVETKETGWVGRRYDENVYIDFTFDEPTRVVRIDMDDVKHSGVRDLEYEYLNYNNTTWTGTMVDFNSSNTYGDISASLHHADTFKLIQGTDHDTLCSGSPYNDCRWVNEVENISDYFSSYTSSQTSDYGDWEYNCVGLPRQVKKTIDYKYIMGVTKIKVEAGNDLNKLVTLYETGVTDNTIFEGTALFLHNNRYKHYRVHLLESCKDVCPNCLQELDQYKLLDTKDINIYDLTNEDLNSSNIDTIFMSDKLYENEYNSTPISGTKSLTITNRLMTCYNDLMDDYEYICNYSFDVDFNFDTNRTSFDTKDMGWVVNGDEGSFRLKLDKPSRITRIDFNDVIHKGDIVDETDYHTPIWDASQVVVKGKSGCWYDLALLSHITNGTFKGSASGNTSITLNEDKAITHNGEFIIHNKANSTLDKLLGWEIKDFGGYNKAKLINITDNHLGVSLDGKGNEDVSINFSADMSLSSNSIGYINDTKGTAVNNTDFDIINTDVITSSGISVAFKHTDGDTWNITDYTGSINPYIISSSNSEIQISMNGDAAEDVRITFKDPVSYSPVKSANILYKENTNASPTLTVNDHKDIDKDGVIVLGYTGLAWSILDRGPYSNTSLTYNSDRRVDVLLDGFTTLKVSWSTSVTYAGSSAPSAEITNISDQTLIHPDSYIDIGDPSILNSDATIKLRYKGSTIATDFFGDPVKEYLGWEVVSYNGSYSNAVISTNNDSYAGIVLNDASNNALNLYTKEPAKVKSHSTIEISLVDENGNTTATDINWRVKQTGDIGLEGVKGSGTFYAKFTGTRLEPWWDVARKPYGYSDTGVFSDLEDVNRPKIITGAWGYNTGKIIGFSFDGDGYNEDVLFECSKTPPLGTYIKVVMTYSDIIDYPEITIAIESSTSNMPKIALDLQYEPSTEAEFRFNIDYTQPTLPEVSFITNYNEGAYPVVNIDSIDYSEYFDKWYAVMDDSDFQGAGCSDDANASVFEHSSYGIDRYSTSEYSYNYKYSITSMVIKASNSENGNYITVFSGSVNSTDPILIPTIEDDYMFYEITAYNEDPSNKGVGMKGLELRYYSCDDQFYDFGIKNLRMYDYINADEYPKDAYGVSNFKLYKKSCMTDYDYGISGFKVYESHYTPAFNFGIRNLKLFEYEFENNKAFGIRDLKLLEYECENDNKFGISNLKFYDYATDNEEGLEKWDYVISDNGKVEKLFTNNVTNINGEYALQVTNNIPLSYPGDFIKSGDSFYIYNTNSDLIGDESVIFEISNGECYDCRLTAWDDATHSTLLNPIFLGDHCHVSAFAFYLKDTTDDSVILNPLDENKVVPIMAPVINRVFKGNTVIEQTELYYGDFDLLDRQATNERGDYLMFKPMLYGIDENMPYGIHDFLIVLHYSYT